MKPSSLSPFAVAALLSSLALFSMSAAAEQPINAASAAPTEAVEKNTSIPEGSQPNPFFDPDELAELATLESENAALEEQKAGFFGPRLGTIIIIGVLLILLL